jgi:hypothetical protein
VNKKKALLTVLVALFVASVAAATVPQKNGPFTMFLLADDISNTVYGTPPCDATGSNPGNDKCNGEAGENPNGDDGWGSGSNGTSQ